MLRTHVCWFALGSLALIAVGAMGGCGSDEADGDSTDPGDAGSGGAGTDAGPDGDSGSGATGGSGGTGATGGSGGDASVDPDATAEGGQDAPSEAAEDVVVGDVICTPGTYQCNANTLVKCIEPGTEWVDYWSCATSALCDATGGRCHPPACLPAEHRCNGATLEVCKSDQTGWETKQVCNSAAHCRAEFQTCGATPCPPGAYQCSGSVLQVCNDTQTGWDDVDDCLSSALCDAANETCTPSECTPGEISCEGANLRTCKFTLDGWENLETCSSEDLCDEAGGQCDVCVADAYRCSGAELYLCSETGQQETLEDTCSSPERCNPVSGRCDPACDSGNPGAGLNCGAGQDQDCCASPAIPGGTFSRSYDEDNYTDDTYVATVADFEIDTFEVTVGRFREFVEAGLGTQASPPAAGDGAHPLIADSGWDASWDAELSATTTELTENLNCDLTFQTWSDDPGANETKPINCVTWYEAFAYCAWAGGRLPTEAEWNYAASGGDEHRVYPWGDGIDHDHAVWGCETDGVPGCTSDDIVMVGSRSPLGDGKWGHVDLAGSMSEWVLPLAIPQR